MRPHGTAGELERRRRLAVERICEGWLVEDVAEFLGVTPRTVQRWVKEFRDNGDAGLAAKPHIGHPRLTPDQEATVVGWVQRNPTEFGFGTELWTARRIGQLIEKFFHVKYNFRYISAWLSERGVSPQKPQRVPRERNPVAIGLWVRNEWSRIKKKPRPHGLIRFSLTRRV
jgi:transposase